MGKPDPNLLAAMNACAVHASDLLKSAEAIQAIGRSNIAYHLATLSLEELGRRKLIAIQSVAAKDDGQHAWQRATQDHVKKLFWCFYGFSDIDDMIDQAKFFEMSDLATTIHANRLAGLYVDDGGPRLSIPSKAILPKQAQNLIDLARTFLGTIASETPREDIPQDEIDLQAWLVAAFDDPERRKHILTTTSFAKLKEMQDVLGWTRWIKSEIERLDAELQSLAQREIQRGNEPSGADRKDKWKITFRIETHSHSIRPGPLKAWNAAIHWIKLVTVQGVKSKNELLIELILGDSIPIQGLWEFGFSIANHFIVALNLATSGFWWWALPRHKGRYYEKIWDLENGLELRLDRADFQFFSHRRPVLNEAHLNLLTRCMSALPGPADQKRAPAYNYYLGGLTFLSLNDIHWRCEAQAFGNFLQSLKLVMTEANYPQPSEPWDQAVGRLLREKYPDLDPLEHDAFVNLIGVFEAHRQEQPLTKPADVYLIKLLCETLLRDRIVPAVLKEWSKPHSPKGGNS